MIITVDCKIYNTKRLFLAEMQKAFKETYALNYDAFIDGARGIDRPLTVEIYNFNSYENAQDLTEVLDIIEKENALIKFIKK